MTYASLTCKNLARNKLRLLLTLAAIGLPLFVFTLTKSLKEGVERFLQNSDQKLRVAVHHKLSFTLPLPQRLRGELEALAPEGYVQGICRTAWLGGRVEGQQFFFPNMGVDKDTLAIVYPEYEMTPEEILRFQEERQGAVVGVPLAKAMNWKIGDKVTLKGEIPPFPEVEVVICAIPRGLKDTWLFFGMDYYNEIIEQATGEPVWVNNFWLRCTSPKAREWALNEIDKHFSQGEIQTRTELESTFIESFIKSGGDWIQMVWTIGRLVILVALSVGFSTMSMAFRERVREIAVMRAIGFKAGAVTRMILSEGFLIGLIGGALATVPIYVLSHSFDLVIPNSGFSIEISENTLAAGLIVGVACGLLAAWLPAASAGRLRVATALRKVV